MLQFVYESEKKEDGDTHNKLLKQIQGGIKLKKIRTNDRSKPNLDGKNTLKIPQYFTILSN